MKFLIFLLFVIAVATFEDINANPLKGRNVVVPAQENEFPFIVSLASAPATEARHHYCGGTLISKKHILTAKHCLEDRKTGKPLRSISDIRVIIGSIDMTRGRKLRITTWKTFIDWALENNIHDKIADNLYHDVAIATLSEEVLDITPVTISQLNHDQILGQDVVTAGWGDGDDGVESQFLQKAPLQVISKKNCIKNFVKTGAPMNTVINNLSTMHRPAVVLGLGDSGGPLLLNGTHLIGLNAANCPLDIEHPNQHNIHPSVEYYREFIEAFTEEHIKAPLRVYTAHQNIQMEKFGSLDTPRRSMISRSKKYGSIN